MLQWSHALWAWCNATPWDSSLRWTSFNGAMPCGHGATSPESQDNNTCSDLQWSHAFRAWCNEYDDSAQAFIVNLQWSHASRAWCNPANLPWLKSYPPLQWSHALKAWCNTSSKFIAA